MASAAHTEIEVRFLEIDPKALRDKLKALGAEDLGEELLKEVIFQSEHWHGKQRRVRVRRGMRGITLAYKHNVSDAVDGTTEIELKVDSFDKSVDFLKAIGLQLARHQEKRRHSFKLDDVEVEIDSWPLIPPFVELDGPSEQALCAVASKLGLDWAEANMENAKKVIEGHYGVPISTYTHYTFEKAG